MPHQADFYWSVARDSPFNNVQAIGTVATWTWVMADIDRYMDYSVVSTNSNVAVSVLRIDRCIDRNAGLLVRLVVSVTSFDAGATGLAPLNFFAVRIPPQ
jgi:hypothetical protein